MTDSTPKKDKSWKDALLKSGMPFEYEVKRYLESQHCLAAFEYSYLRPDEFQRETQFSYDVDATLFHREYWVNLMVECKYRHDGVSWVFAPDAYDGPDEVSACAFLHPFDHFIKARFPFGGGFPCQLAPCCSKGIELRTDSANDDLVMHALSQLAYGFAPQIADAMRNQVERVPRVGGSIFCHVPIVATTARLFRLRDDAGVDSIKRATSVEDVATHEDCLVLKYKCGVELRQYNLGQLGAVVGQLGEDTVKDRLSTFTTDVDHFISVLADRSPQAIVIVSTRNGWQAFDRLIQWIKDVLTPSEAVIAAVRAEQAKIEAMIDELGLRKVADANAAKRRAEKN